MMLMTLNGPNSLMPTERRGPTAPILSSPCCAVQTCSAACRIVPRAQPPPSPSEKQYTPFGWVIFGDSGSSVSQTHTRQLQKKVVGGRSRDAGQTVGCAPFGGSKWLKQCPKLQPQLWPSWSSQPVFLPAAEAARGQGWDQADCTEAAGVAARRGDLSSPEER